MVWNIWIARYTVVKLNLTLVDRNGCPVDFWHIKMCKFRETGKFINDLKGFNYKKKHNSENDMHLVEINFSEIGTSCLMCRE